MSDFLGNLAARSIGSAETIQPRIPPLFAPQGTESGLMATRAGSRRVSREGRSEDDSVVDDSVVDEGAPVLRNRQERRRLEAVSPAALPAEPVRAAPVNELRESRVPAAAGRDEISNETPTSPAGGIARNIPAGFDAPKRQARAESPRPVRDAVSREQRGVVSEHPSMPPSGTQSPKQPPVDLSARAASVEPVRIPPTTMERTTIEHTPMESTSVEPASAKAPGAEPAEPSVRRRVTRAAQDEPAPPSASTDAPASAESAALRSEIAVRAAVPLQAAKPPAQSAPGSGPAGEPQVRISIGRVDVRAVFPEPAARRTPAPRQRPTVSLDDYLKQSNRGNR